MFTTDCKIELLVGIVFLCGNKTCDYLVHLLVLKIQHFSRALAFLYPLKKLNPTAIESSGVSVHLFNPNLLNYENLIFFLKVES